MPAWIPYTLLRLALFGAAFALLYLLGFGYFWSALIAIIVGFTVAYIFFPTLRNRVSIEFGEARDRRRDADADAATAPARDERGVDERAEDA